MPSLEELLSDDQELLEKVKAKVGDQKLHVTSDGSWIPKEKFNDLNTEKKDLQTQLTQRDKQLKELESSAGDAEKFKAEVERMQKENKDAQDQFNADMQALKLSTALKTHLIGKVHNPDVAAKLLDQSKLSLAEDGTLKGLDEQITALEKSDAYLFVPKTPEGQQNFKPYGAAPGSSNTEPPAPGSAQGYGKAAAKSKVTGSQGSENPYFN